MEENICERFCHFILSNLHFFYFWGALEHVLEAPLLHPSDFTVFLTTVQHPHQPLSPIQALTVAQNAEQFSNLEGISNFVHNHRCFISHVLSFFDNKNV